MNGQELAAEIEGTIRRHVALGQHYVTATVLWVFFTYCFKAAEVAPILAIISPIKRCGKSTLLDIVSFLVPRRLSSSNITAAAMFRVVDKYSPTLLVDEADTFLNKNDELRGIINASHYKSTAYVLRSAGDDHEPRQFSTWCPKAIALIGRLRDTMEDRSIVIQMRRRKPSEEVAKFRREVLNRTLDGVRRRLARWAADHVAQLQSAEPEMPDILEDRAADNSWLLLAIADEVGGVWPQRAREAAITLSTAASEEDGTIRVQLLADIRQVFNEKGTDFLKSKVLLEHLHEMDERPWGEWGRTCKPMSARQLRSQLKPFGVESRQKKIQGVAARCLSRIEELCRASGVLVIGTAREARRTEPDFEAQPALEPLGREPAMRLFLRRLWGTAQFRRLAELGGGAALYGRVAGCLAGVRCYRLRPGRYDETLQLLESLIPED